ncbi:hypothetical protein [Basilea psittacipulmonis]|nr:hypothetical protein [Basilea psittacipulmonis]
MKKLVIFGLSFLLSGCYLMSDFPNDIAYYRDEEVINFMFPKDPNTLEENKQAEEIKAYQKKVWGQVGPKTQTVNFDNNVLSNDEEDKE